MGSGVGAGSQGWRAALRRSTAWLFRLRGSPEAIALGLGLGTFVALTPTVGVQLVAALALATLLRASRPAAAAAVMLTNPLTIPPTFAFTYWVGTFFWDGPPPARAYGRMVETVRRLGRHDFWELTDQAGAFFELSRDVFVPLWIGGVLVGCASGTAVYALSLPALRSARRRRERRRQGGRRRGSRVAGSVRKAS